MVKVNIALKSKKMTNDFCDCIEVLEKDKALDAVKVADTFGSLNDECLGKLTTNKPDVLLLGIEFGRWKQFCEKIRAHQELKDLKILVIVTYEEYIKNKKAIDELTNGYISMDYWEKIVVTAIKSVCNGDFFRYDMESGEEEPTPEWILSLNNTIITETIKNANVEGYYVEMVKNLTKIIESTEKTRNAVIKILLTEKREQLDKDGNDEYDFETLLIDNLILKGYSNWKIADTLKKYDDPDYLNKVRIKRLDLNLRIAGKNTMVYRRTRKGKPISLSYREIKLLRMIAAGYSNDEIAYHLCKTIDTIKSNRKMLNEKFLETSIDNENSSMSVVIKALQAGMIKVGEIVALMTDESRIKYRTWKQQNVEKHED